MAALVVLACLGVAISSAWAQAPQPVPMVWPDLVVTRITLKSWSGVGGTPPYVDMSISVRNAGKGNSGPCEASMCFTSDITGTEGGSFQPRDIRVMHKPVPGLEAGRSAEILFQNVPAEWGPWKVMIIAIVDVPMPGHPLGQVNEFMPTPNPNAAWGGPGEQNNAWAVSFQTGPGTNAPYTIRNPAYALPLTPMPKAPVVAPTR